MASLSWYKIIALSISLLALVGCAADEGWYLGDGESKFIKAPLFGEDGYEIIFPEMQIEDGKRYKYSITKFPKMGRYQLYLSVPPELYDSKGDIQFAIKVYKNGSLYASHNTNNEQVNKTSSNNFYGFYFDDLMLINDELIRNSPILIENNNDIWEFEVEIFESSFKIDDLKGNLLLRIYGYK